MGIKGEPSTPIEPARGLVWSAILEQVDRVGSESEYISVADTPRGTFGKHPWSIGGGGATDLKDWVEAHSTETLGDAAADIGYGAVTRENDAYILGAAAIRRAGIDPAMMRPLVDGESVRDWSTTGATSSVWPYEQTTLDAYATPALERHLWPFKAGLSSRVAYGKTQIERELKWFEYSMFFKSRFATPLSIAFAFVATHNHFFLDRGGRVFIQSAPIIKLPSGASEDHHLALLGLLNSSVACFWMKQVMHDKGNGGIGGGIASEDWERFYEFTSTGVKDFPLAAERPLPLARRLDTLASQLGGSLPVALLAAVIEHPTRATLDSARRRAESIRGQMIAAQEELDWQCYRLYGLVRPDSLDFEFTGSALPEVALGERAFEIALARRMAAGRETTSWFERHGSTPITELPSQWPEDYRQLVQRRIDLIERDRNIGLIEQPEYKRRWNTPAWDDLERAALRDWLLDRLEATELWPASVDQPPHLTTVNRLADAIRSDGAFMQIAELYAGHSGFDVTQVVAELVASESVPFLPALRYADTGLRKRAQWEDTWALQRREDAGEKVGKIPVPPRYQSKDFLKADFWRLRGGLDLPKERWVSYPGCERGADASLLIAWAGWNHLQQATALAAYYLEMKENEGWEPVRLQPLLAGLLELVPWLEQWHNEIDPAYGERMGTYYRGFVNEEARALGFTVDDLRAWKPVVTGAKRGRKKASQPS